MSNLFGYDPKDLIQEFYQETGYDLPEVKNVLFMLDMDLSKIKHGVIVLENDLIQKSSAKPQLQEALGMAFLAMLTLGPILGIDPIEGLRKAIFEMAALGGVDVFICPDCDMIIFNEGAKETASGEYVCIRCFDK